LVCTGQKRNAILAPMNEKPRPEISLVVPVFNEESALEKNIRRLIAFLETLTGDWELVLVDDGSTDGSLAIMRSFENERVRVIHYLPNRGRGQALRRGLLEARGRVVLTTEADGSWDLDCLQRLVELVRQGAALAVASPYLPGGRLCGVPLGRRLLSRTANLLAGKIIGVSMATGMTRAYQREIIPLVISPCDGKEFHLDVLSRARKTALDVREAPARLEWVNSSGRRRRAGFSFLICSALRHLVVLGRFLLEK